MGIHKSLSRLARFLSMRTKKGGTPKASPAENDHYRAKERVLVVGSRLWLLISKMVIE